MKKIYLTISAIALTLFTVAQQQHSMGELPSTKEAYQPKTKTFNTIKNKKVSASGAFSGRYDVSYSLPNAHGKTLGTGMDYGIYVSPTFVDSTVKKSFATSSVVSNYKIGVNFDPKSIIFDSNSLPLLTPTDSYYLDTVWIGGVYQRRKNDLDDTLIVEIVWGDTANASVFGNWSYTSAPLNGFGTYITPHYATVASAVNNQIKLTAPSTNKLIFRHILTKADSTYLADVSDYLPIDLNGALGQLIPAGNIVSASFAFNSAGTHTNGAISYASSTSSLPGTESGWAAVLYSQDNPVISTIADVSTGYDDFGKGKNSSFYINKNGRYGLETGAFATSARGSFYNGYWIDFSIHATSSVGINELEANGYALGQNAPNPFNGESTITYQLAKDANSVLFTVTDVMGRVISSEKASTSKGSHSIKLGAYAAGVYYYTLNVDGKTSTKKMIAQ